MKNELSANSTLSHYRIVSKIGAGGMGEVYLAQDTKLDRRVALKILPADVASNRERMERFIREAKSAAALSHPNIAQIFEIGEHDGTHFIAMEFIDGQTLREKIHRERTELRKLLRYLQHVAEGLAKAHAAGIVHRDLKPDNIMITRDGHAKILDFGLAKLIEPALAEPSAADHTDEAATAIMQQHSTPGVIMGTVGYMSPEQAQGKTNEIDQRSDIFSFGCILFEAATGHKPFEGDLIVKSLHRLIYEPAPQIKDLNPSAPADLQRIIRRCLAKDKEERYQTIKDVAIELKELRRELDSGAGFDTTVPPPASSATALSTDGDSTVQSTAARSASIAPTVSSAEYLVSGIGKHKFIIAAGLAILLVLISAAGFWFVKNRGSAGGGTEVINSIAVLPFQNKSADADTDYLSDGLAESLIFRLSQLPGLKVSPTSSVMRYKGKDTDVVKIASELGVDAVMTGRLTKRGDNLNITVELVDTKNNKSLWGEQYERKMSELLATQREIAATIAQKLQLKLAGSESKRITKKYTNNNDAYQLYLKGRFYFARRSDADIRRSIDLFQQAINLDPNFALAYVGIGESWAVMPSYPYMESKDAMPLAKAAIAKALEIDPDVSEAHTVAGMIAATYDWDWAKSESEFKRSLELDPNLAITHYRYAWTYLSPMGRHDEAIAEMSRAMELEPLSLVQGANFAGVYIYARQYDRALDQARKTYDMDTTLITGQNWMCHALDVNGKYAESLAISEKVSQTNGLLYAALGYAYAKSGRPQEAEAVLDRLNEIEKTKTVSHYWEAITYAALGEKDKAFAELEKAYQARDWFLQRLKVDPFLDPLRDDRRFGDLVKRIGLPQ
jgi:serine/threonine protein kinase/tetratricopeptide (TPR) repeat protein